LCGKSAVAKVVSAGTVRPNPIPIRAVDPSRRMNAAACEPKANRLAMSSAIDDRSAARPRMRTHFSPQRRASVRPSSEAVTAMTV
jgi:hypothetical protein